MKRYFVWKDANCNGKNVEWKEITGTEFYALKRAEPHRRFILWKNEDDPMDDGMLYEATEENYKEWDRERKRKEREDKYVEEHFTVFSIDDPVGTDDEEGLTWADIIPDTRDEETQYEEEVEKTKNIMLKMLPEAMNELPKNQSAVVDIILSWYGEEIERRKEAEKNTKEDWKRNILNARPFVIPEDELAEKLDISKRTFNYRKNAAYEKMRQFYEKNLPERKIMSSRK